MAGFCHLFDESDDVLERHDPVELNLLVAKSIPALADLHIPKYLRWADEAAAGVEKRLRAVEHVFHQTPADWDHDIRLFRLGVLCEYLDCELGIRYIDDQRDLQRVKYTDPSHLFLNGVMDTKQGTCGSLATLHVVIGRRLGWPVGLAAVKSHFVCRYDDGEVTHNIETTQGGHGGFKTDPDDYLIRQHGLPPIAVESGSDLRMFSVREMLGVFVGARGRHMRDTGRMHEAERDYLLARSQCPANRRLYVDAMTLMLDRGETLFEIGEEQFATPTLLPPDMTMLRRAAEYEARRSVLAGWAETATVYSVPLTTWPDGTPVIDHSGRGG